MESATLDKLKFVGHEALARIRGLGFDNHLEKS